MNQRIRNEAMRVKQYYLSNEQ